MRMQEVQPSDNIQRNYCTLILPRQLCIAAACESMPQVATLYAPTSQITA